MRTLCIVLVAACGSAPPPVTTSKFAGLTSAACTIRGPLAHELDLRYHNKPITRVSDDFGFTIRMHATAERATAQISDGGHTYDGDVVLGDVRVIPKDPMRHHDWLTVAELKILRIEGANAVVQPAVELPFELANLPTFTIACDALQFGQTTNDPDLSAVTPLATGQILRLLDAPAGRTIATVSPGTARCGGNVEAYVTAVSGDFRRLRLPTPFGILEAWAENPKLLTADTKVQNCGRPGGPGNYYYLDTAHACSRETPLFVDDGRQVIQIGVIAANIDIEVQRTVGDRGELATPRPDALTPFVWMRDLERCPLRGSSH